MVIGSPVSFRKLGTATLTGVLVLGLTLPVVAQARPAAQPQGSPTQTQASPAPAQTPGAPAQAPAIKAQGKTIPGPVQVKPTPIFPTTPEEQKKFAVEFIINYSRRQYRPTVTIDAVNRGGATYSTPEEAFIAQMSAMRSGDYDWWLTGWTEASRKQIQQRDAELKRGAAFWRQAWEKNLNGRQVNLLERLESGIYVVLVYSITIPAQDNREEFRSMFVTKKEGERWVSTQELGNDYLYHHYLEGRNRVSQNTQLQPFPDQTATQIASEGVWKGRLAQNDFFKAYTQGREDKVTNVIR